MHVFRVLAATLLAALLTIPALTTSGSAREPEALGAPLTVMTRNVYLGTDLFPVLDAATVPGAREQQIARVAGAMHEAQGLLDDTAYDVRARLIATEIATHEPDLVGLQEVALWRSGPLEPARAGVPDATSVDLDFLEILLHHLDLAGQSYRVVNVVPELDLEAPSRADGNDPGADVRLTLRDVQLVREDSELAVTARGSDNFTAAKRFPFLGRRLDFTRGYAWADLDRDGQQLRFITTHLEVGDPRVSNNQVRELVTGPAATKLPVVLVCDCNTDPLGKRRSMSYRAITGAGFDDAWLRLPDAGAGNTCCMHNHLRSPGTSEIDHRVDFVFVRADGPVVATEGTVLGTGTSSRDVETGLWPSDHAGVVLRLENG